MQFLGVLGNIIKIIIIAALVIMILGGLAALFGKGTEKLASFYKYAKNNRREALILMSLIILVLSCLYYTFFVYSPQFI